MTSPPLRWVAVFAVLPLRGYLCVRLRGERPLAFRRPAQSDGAVPAHPPPPLTHFDTYLHTTYLLDISISPDFAFMQMLVLVMATMLVLAMAVSPLLLLCAPGDVVPHVHS